MYFKEYYPSLTLTKYIDSYFVVDTNEVHEDITDLVIPDGTFGLLFIDSQKNIQRNFKTTSPPIQLKKTSVFGQKTTPINYYYSKGNEKSFGVKINPAGLALFLDNSFNEFKNLFVEIELLSNTPLLNLEQQVLEATNIENKIQIIEKFATNRLNILSRNSDYMLFSIIVDFIKEKKGEIRFDYITEHFNINYKKIERLFNHFLGITPKTYIRIVRFNATIHIQSKIKDLNLTQLGYELGFFDQSHFIREFKTFTSLTPKDFFNKPLSESEEIHLNLISSRW